MAKKIITKVIPAGMQINIVEDIKCQNELVFKKSKNIEGNFQNWSNLLENCTLSDQTPSTSQISTKIKFKNYEEDRHNASPQSNLTPPKSICRGKSISPQNLNLHFNENAGFHQDIKNFKSTQTLNDDIKECDSNGKHLSFKEKMQQRLQKSLEKKKQRQVDENRKGVCSIRDLNNLTGVCYCENCDYFINCPNWCAINIKFDNSKLQTVKKSHPLFKTNPSEKQPEIMKKICNKIVLHSVIIPNPVNSINDTYLDENVQNALKSLNIISTKTIQSYMWPSVQRGLNIIMIGPPGSGKSLSYLPFFCSFSMEKQDKYADLLNYEGPIIIILCLDNRKCDKISAIIQSLINCDNLHSVAEHVTEESKMKKCNCNILITTPSTLEECLIAGTVKLHRLCHVAIEDAHEILKIYSRNMSKLFKAMNELQINRPNNRSIQLIVSSEKWSVDIETLLKKLYVTPLVCFQDYLEAAIYSKITFKQKKLKSAHKLYYLDDILKLNYMSKKTVIFCDENDMVDVREHLQINGIECIMISDNLIEDEIFENEEMWFSLLNGSYKVMLCSDTSFEKTVHISNAQWLVHLQLPKNWKQFSKRFRCLSANFTSPLTVDVNMSLLQSFLIIDESCDSELLDFFELLTRNAVVHLQIE